jgi:hypothetical protein
MTPFESIIRRKFEDTDTDIDYYLETIRKFPEGEWVAPSGADGTNGYRIFAELYHEKHLVAVKIKPIWVNGSFRGQRIFYMYKEDMKYAE